MTTNPQPVEQLEQLADREREQLSRRVAEIRYDLRERLDIRRNAEEQIRDRPGAIYGAAAGLAALAGYIFARLVKA
jgi:hypothetical protein